MPVDYQRDEQHHTAPASSVGLLTAVARDCNDTDGDGACPADDEQSEPLVEHDRRQHRRDRQRRCADRQ